jgi:hypothetical protein
MRRRYLTCNTPKAAKLPQEKGECEFSTVFIPTHGAIIVIVLELCRGRRVLLMRGGYFTCNTLKAEKLPSDREFHTVFMKTHGAIIVIAAKLYRRRTVRLMRRG